MDLFGQLLSPNHVFKISIPAPPLVIFSLSLILIALEIELYVIKFLHFKEISAYLKNLEILV